MKECKVEIVWVKAAEMLADCRTKRGGQTYGLMDVITSGILPRRKKHGDNKTGVHMVDIDERKDEKYENK